MTITPREKNFLFVMVIAIVIGGGFKVFIEPEINKNAELSIRYEEALMNQGLLQLEIDALPTIIAEHGVLTQDLIYLQESIGPYLYDEEVDRLLLGYALPLDLTILELELRTEQTTVTPASPLPTVEGEEEVGVEIPSMITSKLFSISVLGTTENTILFIKELLALDDIVLTEVEQTLENQGEVSVVEGRIYMRSQG